MKPIYAFDIETDTAAGGLDPRRARITSFALSGSNGLQLVVEDPNEYTLLKHLDEALRDLEPGYLAGWNSGPFDLPFCHDRSTGLAAPGRPAPITSLFVTGDSSVHCKYSPLGDHLGAFRGRWAGHDHVDISSAYSAEARAAGVSASLKPTALRYGIKMIEVDRAHMDQLTAMERVAYNLSDTNGTLQLAQRLGPELDKWADSHHLNPALVNRLDQALQRMQGRALDPAAVRSVPSISF